MLVILFSYFQLDVELNTELNMLCLYTDSNHSNLPNSLIDSISIQCHENKILLVYLESSRTNVLMKCLMKYSKYSTNMVSEDDLEDPKYS